MEFKDYYRSLGVEKTATAGEIKKAYRTLARKYHPDVNPGDHSAESRFKDINEAYEVLGDADKRRKYDELGANWRLYEQAEQRGQGPVPGGWPSGGADGGWTINVEGGPGGGRGFRTMSEEDVREIFGEDPFSDFFKTFFGGAAETGRRRSAGRAARRRGQNVEEPIELTLEEAFHGVTERLSITTGGRARTVDVRIPPGVSDGSRIRLAGEGHPGTGGAASGDLYLRVQLKRHPMFELKGRDLHARASVPVTTAVLGGQVDVPTLAGKSLRLKIPPATQQGQVFRLKGQGMPAAGRPDDRGDLYATIQVKLPTHLTAEARRHYQALAELENRTNSRAAP
jgi:DnaJ-class molecular chaperone